MTTAARVMAVIGQSTWNPNLVTPAARLAEDLQLDSLDRVEIMLNLEHEFSIEIDDAEHDRWQTVQHVIQCVSCLSS